MTIAIPRCLCGATVANCVIQKCESVMNHNPNALVTINEWRKACLLESARDDWCQNPIEQRDACSITYNEKLINAYNARQNKNIGSDFNKKT